ncbi:MAG: hypothetical protein RL376_91 [Verrucomicrobiota bacterium]|jgi:hypothetical protein
MRSLVTPANIALLTAFLVFPGISQAAAITITNAGFETPTTGAGTFQVSAAPNGWSAYGTIDSLNNRVVGVLNPSSTTLYASGAAEGSNVGVVFLGDAGSGVESGLVQTLSATLALNTRYVLTVAVGNITNDAQAPHNSFNFTGFPGYRVDFLAGGTVIASDNNSLLPPEGQFLTSTVDLSIGASHAQAGQTLGIRLVNLDGANGLEVNFDDVRLDASPIPEPATASLVLGAAALVGVSCRRRRR